MTGNTTTAHLGERRTPRVLALAALALMAVLWVGPFVWNVVTSFKTDDEAIVVPIKFWPESWTLENYATIFGQGNVLRWMANSLLVSTAVTVITVAVSAMAAYALSRTDFTGRRVLQALTLGSIMVPAQILIVPLFQQMMFLNMVDTFWAVVLPQAVAPVMVFILKKFFDAIPKELEEAARVDGAGPFRIFWTIILPLSRSILAAVAIFVFIGAWNNFLWPFIITNNPDLMTLPVGLSTVKNAYGVQYAQNAAAAVIGALPLLLVFLVFQRQIVKGVATTGMGGQ